jgi:hypothetical protein
MTPLLVSPRIAARAALVTTISLVSVTACSPIVADELVRDENAYRQAVAAVASDRQIGDDAAADADARKLSLAIKQLREDRGTERDPNHDPGGHGGGGGGGM